MRYVRRQRCSSVSQIIILYCSVGASLVASSFASGDDIRASLDEALVAYDAQVADIEREAEKGFADLLNDFADRGDLERAKEIEAHADRFLTEAVLSDVPILRAIREKAKAKFVKANRDLRTAYRAAVAAYTRERNFPAAEEVSKSLREFESQQRDGRLVFPRAEKRLGVRGPEAHNGSGGGGTAGGPQQPKPALAGARQGRAPPAKKAGASAAKVREPSDKLKEIIDSGDERDVLSDRLATAEAKSQAMSVLYDRILKKYPPKEWTFGDCTFLGDLSVESYAGCKSLRVPYAIKLVDRDVECAFAGYERDPADVYYYTADDGGIRDNTPREPTGTMVRSRFYVLWLVSSVTPAEFVSRTKELQGIVDMRSIDCNLSQDEFKTWLSHIRCENLEEIKQALGDLKRAGVSFTAIRRFSDSLGF